MECLNSKGNSQRKMRTEILYEDRSLLVVRKPAGLATQTAGVGQPDVVSELKNYLAAAGGERPPYLGVIHRLDQPVEGLLVFARNKQAAGALTRQLAGQPENRAVERSLHKSYLAVVYGSPSQREGDLADDMYRDAAEGRAVIVEDGAKCGGSGSRMTPKKARLHYRILQTVRTPAGDEISLADIRIDTGRFHQIRAQMAHAGMPLLGDEKYAPEEASACSRRLGIRTAALCAGSLSFVHPVTGKRLYFETRPMSAAFRFFQLEEICK